MVWIVAVALSGLTIGIALGRTSSPPAAIGTHGFDISWPQCRGHGAHHLPAGRPVYVILGLTHGLGHTSNPCLRAQLGWARSRGVRVGAYLVASYPSSRQRARADDGPFGRCRSSTGCRLRNDGAAQARDALATMRANGMDAPRVWIDVEFRHVLPWSHHNRANAAVVQGIVRGLRAAHMPLGVYTTSLMWRDIVGRYRLHVPNWLPVGHGHARRAMTMCRATATGGATWLVQYTRSLDSDLTCPVLEPVPTRHDKLWPYRKTTEQLLSRGKAVRAVQHVVGVRVTGAYDVGTAQAVGEWQRAHHLPATGRVTPYDWRAMGAYRTTRGHPFWLSRIASRH